MVRQLEAARIPVEKIEVNPVKMQSITGKISALLAGDRNLKETAQRAFNSYVKSVFLMKNKQMFDVKSIDMDKFAESLGLAAAPRVRFLERMEKKNNVKKFTEEEEPKVAEKKEVVKFNDDNDNSEDEMFSVKRVDHQIDAVLSSKEIEGDASGISKKDDKVITKAQAAKKLLKKKIGNTKIVFDEEGDVVLDAAKQKQSKEGQEYEDDDEERIGGGINIDQAKEILKAEDKFDKAAERARIREKHKEDKRKLKEEKARRKASEKKDGSDEEDDDSDDEEEGSEPDLSWLPDPDKLYADKTEEDEENSDGSGSDDETETVEVKEGKRALTVIKSVIPAKKSRQESSSDEDDNDDILDTGLSLGEDEDLALKLLSK